MNQRAVNIILIAILLTTSILILKIEPSISVIRRVPEDYPTIQAAINAASPGDTIIVAPGTYAEYVCINKSITLLGTNRQSIITGASTPARVVDVKVGSITFTGNVKISGFTIIGYTTSHHGIFVEPPVGKYFNNINITDNTIKKCNNGIFYSRSTNCYIINNTLQSNTYGIRLYDSNYNLVAENFINASTYYGINFYARSKYNNITKNTIINGRYGVLLEYANYTTMYLNTIKTHTDYAIRLSYTFNSLIKGNTLQNNKYGVYVWNCSQNQFYYNNFINNTIQVEKYDAVLTQNLWDTNICPGAKGNYWSDYGGVDDGSGVGRWGEPRYAGDGVGDTKIPHSQTAGVSWFGLDWYPLMYPWTPVPQYHPVAIFTWDPIKPIVNLPALFNASQSYDTDGVIVEYKWNFGDGNITTTSSPLIMHTFKTAGNLTVTLTVKDNDGLTNSTTHIIQVLPFTLEIDVYTQHPEPYSGRGPHQPSDAFAPQSKVILYAEVTYNYEPLINKEVVFTVTDPNGVEIVYRTANTSEAGIATVDFRLASNAPFGTYHVLASVEVSGRIANDTLTFQMGWLIEITDVQTVDQYGQPKSVFVKGEQVYFSVSVKNICFTSKNATLTVSARDVSEQLIGVSHIRLEVPPGEHAYGVMFNIRLPSWALPGTSAAIVCAFTTWPWSGGVPYCPEFPVSFMLTAS